MQHNKSKCLKYLISIILRLTKIKQHKTLFALFILEVTSKLCKKLSSTTKSYHLWYFCQKNSLDKYSRFTNKQYKLKILILTPPIY